MKYSNDTSLILEALYTYAHKRPALDFADYGNLAAYRSESRAITQDLHDARELLAVVSRRTITEQQFRSAFESAFSGRLSWDGVKLSYCTGQYWPTEYRKAVCAVLASVLWSYWHEAGITDESIRQSARRELSRGVFNRWFK